MDFIALVELRAWLLKHGAFSNYFITWQLWNKKQRRNSPCIYLWKEVLVHVGCSSSSQIKFLNFSSHYCSAHKLFHFWSINLKSSGHGSSLVLITRLSLSLMNRALQKKKKARLLLQRNVVEWKEPWFLPSQMNLVTEYKLRVIANRSFYSLWWWICTHS